MRILIVEEDDLLVQPLQQLLLHYNYEVDIAIDGSTGLQMASTVAYNLVLLDVILPKPEMRSLCQQLRSRGFQSPGLLLIGPEEGRQRAIALDAGADDYMIKPLDLETLVGRVQSLLWQAVSAHAPILTWGHLSVDLSCRKVIYGTYLIAVSPPAYSILELLLRHPQQLYSSKTLFDQMEFPLDSLEKRSVQGYIKELRQKLRAVGAPEDFIKTNRRLGYQLNPRYLNLLSVQFEYALDLIAL